MILEDGSVPLPDFNNPGSIFGWMVVVSFLAFIGFGQSRFSGLGARAGGERAEPMQQVSVPTPDGGHVVHEVSGADPAVMEILRSHALTIESMQTRLADQATDIARLQRDNSTLHSDLKAAHWDLGRIWAWIKAGCPDPPGPGDMPSYIDLAKHQ